MTAGLHFRLLLVIMIAGLTLHPRFANATPLDFDSGWLELFREEAVAKGVSEETANRVLRNIHPLESVEAQRLNQPEFTKKITLAHYLSKRITPVSIRLGQQKIRENTDLLREVQNTYGVPPQLIMAIWSMESAYGQSIGDTHVIPALLTLANVDPRPDRRMYFRAEAITALRLIDEGYGEIETEKGSRTGAFGQTQFMPGSFKKLGIDGDGDGRVDIWNNLSDVFATTANHLVQSGFQPGQRWGREVRIPQGFNAALASDRLVGRVEKTAQQWAALGIRLPGGGALPHDNNMTAILIAPDYDPKTDTAIHGRTFLVYKNFRVIMDYNSSYKYALAVNMLADAIGNAGETQ